MKVIDFKQISGNLTDIVENVRIGLVALSEIGCVSDEISDNLMSEFLEKVWEYEPFRTKLIEKDNFVEEQEDVDISELPETLTTIDLTEEEKTKVLEIFASCALEAVDSI